MPGYCARPSTSSWSGQGCCELKTASSCNLCGRSLSQDDPLALPPPTESRDVLLVQVDGPRTLVVDLAFFWLISLDHGFTSPFARASTPTTFNLRMCRCNRIRAT